MSQSSRVLENGSIQNEIARVRAGHEPSLYNFLDILPLIIDRKMEKLRLEKDRQKENQVIDDHGEKMSTHHKDDILHQIVGFCDECRSGVFRKASAEDRIVTIDLTLLKVDETVALLYELRDAIISQYKASNDGSTSDGNISTN